MLYCHPLYWWARREVQFARELIADDCAARFGGKQSYVEDLIGLVRSGLRLAPGPIGVLGILHFRTQFYRRMKMLMQREKALATRSSAAWKIAVLLACGVLLAAAVALLGVPAAVAEPALADSTAADKAGSGGNLASPDADEPGDNAAPGQARETNQTGDTRTNAERRLRGAEQGWERYWESRIKARLPDATVQAKVEMADEGGEHPVPKRATAEVWLSDADFKTLWQKTHSGAAFPLLSTEKKEFERFQTETIANLRTEIAGLLPPLLWGGREILVTVHLGPPRRTELPLKTSPDEIRVMVSAASQSEIVARVEGPVVEAPPVDWNAGVKRGQLLFRIDDSDAVLKLKLAKVELDALASKEAALKEAQLSLKSAEDEYQRLTELAKNNAVSLAELSRAKLDRERAMLAVDRLAKELASSREMCKLKVMAAEQDVLRCRIEAPGDGTVAWKSDEIVVGSWAKPSRVLYGFEDWSRFKVHIKGEVPSWLASGREVSVTAAPMAGGEETATCRVLSLERQSPNFAVGTVQVVGQSSVKPWQWSGNATLRKK